MSVVDRFSHGEQPCRACFPSWSDQHWHSGNQATFRSGRTQWWLRPNPGYWGDQDPAVLVLGFSKGGDQQRMIDLYREGRCDFDDIPFNSETGSMRRALAELLATLGLVEPGQSIDHLFRPGHHGYGFASLIRCSVEMSLGGKPRTSSGDGILERTVTADLPFVQECAARHLEAMPASVRLVVMLGASAKYVKACREKLGGTPLDPASEVAYAYLARDRIFVHIPHPSGQSGGYRAVFNGIRSPSNDREKSMLRCRSQAIEAAARANHRGAAATR
ncbi:MAG: hypothetical protein ACP5EN_12675 [Rhodovulum sp.]